VALTESDWISHANLRLGQALQNGPIPDSVTVQMMQGLAAELAFLWASHADKPMPRLRFLHTVRDGVSVLMGQLRGKSDGMIGRQLRLMYSQKFRNLKDLWDRLTKELAEEYKAANATGTPAVGRIAARTPRDRHFGDPVVRVSGGVNVTRLPPARVGYADPNNPAWGGSPEWPLGGFEP
jgi:hypothetical protein